MSLYKLIRIFPLFTLSLWVAGCGNPADKSLLTQESRDNVVDVKADIREFEPEEVLIGKNSRLTTGLGKIFVEESTTDSCFVHVFDDRSLKYLGSFARAGRGPEEITIPGALQINTETGTAYLFDHGQMKVMAFNVDSVLAGTDYHPWVRQRFDSSRFPDRYRWISDTLGFGRMINIYEENGSYNRTQTLARYNLDKNELTPLDLPGRHPDAASLFDVSPEENLLVEAYNTNDLINLYDLDGNLKVSVRGPQWKADREDGKRELSFFSNVKITPPYIYAVYSGGEARGKYYGGRIEVFDLEGNYVKTLDTGMPVTDMAVLPDNKGMLISFNGDISFGILSFDEDAGDSAPQEQAPEAAVEEEEATAEVTVDEKSAGEAAEKKFEGSVDFLKVDHTVKTVETIYASESPDDVVIVWEAVENRSNIDMLHISKVVSNHKGVTLEAMWDSIPHATAARIIVDKREIGPLPVETDVYLYVDGTNVPAKLHVIVK